MVDKTVREVLAKELPGWTIVETPAHSGPAPTADAVAPPTWYLKYKASHTPIPDDVKPGYYHIGAKYVLVENHKLVENGARGDVVFKDGFVLSGTIKVNGKLVNVSNGALGWAQG